jgi:CRISPR-associated protein Cmr3
MIEIRPNDVLFFRESRDFTAGQAHVGRTIEPLPHTVAGALMGALFAMGAYDLLNLKVSEKNVSKKPNEEEWRPGFSIEGVFLHSGGEPLFRIPMDIVETEQGPAELRPYWPIEREEPAVYARVEGQGSSGETLRFSPVAGFADWKFLENYLGGKPPFDRIPAGEPYVKEERVGIALDGSKTNVQSMFYRTEFLRLHETWKSYAGIAVYPSAESERVLREHLGNSGILKLGGESRFAEFRFTEGTLPLPGRKEVKEGTVIRVYLATPAVGPLGKLKGEILSELNGKATFLKLFTGRRLPVTGWDMVARMPKPMKYALPAGTVFWFRAEEKLQLPEKIVVGEMTWAGYGLAFTGVLE